MKIIFFNSILVNTRIMSFITVQDNPTKFIIPKNADSFVMTFPTIPYTVVKCVTKKCCNSSAILKTLILKGHIKDIEVDFFEKFSNLEKLVIEYNYNKTFLHKDVFKPLAKLKSLIIQNARIKYFERGVFDHLTELTELSLESINKLVELDRSLFTNLTNLEDLYITDSYSVSLCDGVFDDLENLKVLCLETSGVADRNKNIFSKLVNLEELLLYDNNIANIEKEFFQGLTNLKELNLARNNICWIDEHAFDDLTQLEILHLDENFLEELEYVPNVEKLHVDPKVDLHKFSDHNVNRSMSKLKELVHQNYTSALFDNFWYNTLQNVEGTKVNRFCIYSLENY